LVDRLSFNIDDARLVDENPDSSFATLSLDFFASGPNKHEMFVSDETLFRTADSIKNVPLVWKYDPTFDDAYTHDPEEVPCGFVPESAEIKSKKLEDGRIMLSVISYVWKKYSGKILDFFQRDGEKPVSVEMSVYGTSPRGDGLTELTDFRYEAVTVLGSFVQPAIPMARATVLQFADEYKKAVNLEFGRYEDDVDFTIPANVKSNAQKGLELYKKFKRGGNSVSIAHAKHLMNSNKTTSETVRQASRYITKRGSNKLDEKNPTNNQITFMLWGGEEGASWIGSLSEKMDLIDNKYTSYFDEEGGIMPYGSLKDVNPALKGIDPPITLGQANEIAKAADAIGSDEKKNGWAIAIANFKKNHKVEDGHWVKKEKMSANSDSDEEFQKYGELDKPEKEAIETKMAEDQKEKQETPEEEKTEMAETPEEEKKENPEEEKKETPEEEKKENMSLDSYLDVKATLAFLQDETDKYEELAAEFAKEPKEQMNYGKVMGAMYAKMCKMQEACKMAEEAKTKAEEENRAYMAENEELKKFKAEKEKEQFRFAVDSTLKEIEQKTEIPADELENLRKKAEEFSLETIDAWTNLAKAKGLDFALKGEQKNVVKRYGLPFPGENRVTTSSIWKRD
jgi:hypothetical protein